MKNKIFGALMATLITVGLQGQMDQLGRFIAGGKEDAQKLMEGYMSPYFNALGASLTGGWYNTAKPHQLGGFDLTVTFNTAIVPESDRKLDISELELVSLVPANPSDAETPTIAGEDKDGVQMNYDLPSPIQDQPAFKMPKGTGFRYVPTPMVQAGIGLIKDTEINGRFMPKYSYGDGDVGLWGIGFKHGLKQHLPFIKRVPVLHLTLQYGYTRFNANVGLSVTPETIGASGGAANDWDNQKLEFITQSHTANLLFSANLPVVCFYGGVGIAATKSNVTLKGNYPWVDVETGSTDVQALEDPIDFEVNNSDGSAVKPRLNAGMRLKFGVITFHGDYTYANYSLVTAGIGISFR